MQCNRRCVFLGFWLLMHAVPAGARRAQEEEEVRRQEEEERRKAEEAERRKQERAERRAQLKREGKLLTGKAKKEAERLAAMREQLLKKAGLEPVAPGDDPSPAGPLLCTAFYARCSTPPCKHEGAFQPV
jgi:hypothetical protein